MEIDSVQVRLLAQAVYEIRLLLAGYLGSQSTADNAVRQAAHLAYALHNPCARGPQGSPLRHRLGLGRDPGCGPPAGTGPTAVAGPGACASSWLASPPLRLTNH